MSKLTKQGVRDLSDLGPKKPKVKPEAEKDVDFCAHPQNMIRESADRHSSRCGLCGKEFDWNGVGV